MAKDLPAQDVPTILTSGEVDQKSNKSQHIGDS